MIEIIETDIFSDWLEALRDRQGKARIKARIARVRSENLGDVEPVGGGVSEIKIDCGPGYRVYFIRRGIFIIVLLAGGDKSTQKSDIERAIKIAPEWKE